MSKNIIHYVLLLLYYYYIIVYRDLVPGGCFCGTRLEGGSQESRPCCITQPLGCRENGYKVQNDYAPACKVLQN